MWWTFGSLVCALLLVAVIAWPVTSVWKSRAALNREQEYREVSERSARSLEGTERIMGELQSVVTGLSGRVEVLEKMLAEVD
jgi:flagellar biogenesis protein FliO